MAKTPCSKCRRPGFHHGQGTRSHMQKVKKILNAAMKIEDPECHN